MASSVQKRVSSSSAVAAGLGTDVSALHGVGPATAARLHERGMGTVGALLHFIPRNYEDRQRLTSIAELDDGVPASVQGRVLAAGCFGAGRARRYEIALEDDTGVLRLVFFRFNAQRMRFEYKRGDALSVYGTVTRFRGNRQMTHPEMTHGEISKNELGIVAVYPELAGVHKRKFRQIMQAALLYVDAVEDALPSQLLQRLDLPSLTATFRHLHQPSANDDMAALCAGQSPYHRRLAFDEFFYLQLVLAQRRSLYQQDSAFALSEATQIDAIATQALPFEPTAAQRRVLAEIGQDLQRKQPMARLLQGDVGCGKTAVAAVAALAAIRSGYQVAMLVPTEILADQHFNSLTALCAHAGAKLALLKGSTRVAQRRELLQQIASGDVNLVVGTHALLQPDVVFARLALAVVDEQHRFGVLQRTALAHKGPHSSEQGTAMVPHQLVMTATPIPRSLSMTVYGDLALSVIDELPLGRKPIATSVIAREESAKVLHLMRQELDAGGRIFVVYPLIEESSKLDLANAHSGAEKMQRHFNDVEVGLLTGRMASLEKDQVMERFRSGQARILVATTVVEVGVDVPEATLMVVSNAERFGLSQLHQLRGRVGRGRTSSRCILINGGSGADNSLKRLQVMADTNDGFRIAEEDLAIRGPGDLLGTRQSGMPEFLFADLLRHGKLLELARSEAASIIATDPTLQRHPDLGRALEQRFTGRFALLRSG